MRTNDIPLHLSEGYAYQFRRLIDELGLSHQVELIVESEEFELSAYDWHLAQTSAQPLGRDPTDQEVDNVARFLGRRCSVVEAADRMERYRCASFVTERFFNGLVDGIRLTQRATATTLAFRSFPGGDQRVQTGEVVLSLGRSAQIRPLLLTSRNVGTYMCLRLRLSDVMPEMIADVGVAYPSGDLITHHSQPS